MSNIDKAAESIGQGLGEHPDWRPRILATKLDKAGLLAPDLPQPVLRHKHGGTLLLDNITASVEYHYNPAPSVYVITTGVAYNLTPTEARELAYNLLAAVNLSLIHI